MSETEWQRTLTLQMVEDRLQLLEQMHFTFGTLPGEGGRFQSWQDGYSTALDAMTRRAISRVTALNTTKSTPSPIKEE